MYSNICLVSVAEMRLSWETCFDDMLGETKPFPIPQGKYIRKTPLTLSLHFQPCLCVSAGPAVSEGAAPLSADPPGP